MKRIAVFCSGNGTNFQAINDAIVDKKLDAVIALMVCDNPDAYALTRAKKAGITTLLVNVKEFKNKSEFEQHIVSQLQKAEVELIVLAGFMRIIGADLLSAYPDKIINIHPALLPAFKGAHGIKDALDYGVKATGVTVHFVDGKMDNGPIIMQEVVLIHEDDTLSSLEERIHALEHTLYPAAIGQILSGKYKISARIVELW